MKIVHQLAPPFSALLKGLPGVTEAEHQPREAIWALPSDADVLFVLHGEGDDRGAAHAAPRPAGWPGRVRLVQLASAGADDYPEWLFEAPKVASASGTTAVPIGEFALALMLAHAKRLHEVTLKPGDAWPSREAMMARPLGLLKGRTLGLVGLGNIAQQVAHYAHAFGMRIMASRASNAPSPLDYVTVAPLETVLKAADQLVIAAPIGADTQHLLNAERLGLMQADAHIVNIARGGIIDQDALLAEFAKDRLWASLDVTDPEPLPPGHPLIGHPRANITGHISWSNPDINRAVLERLMDNLRRLTAGEPLLGAIKD
jgi:phosphoglycerate dehydrogenase-like enzyme